VEKLGLGTCFFDVDNHGVGLLSRQRSCGTLRADGGPTGAFCAGDYFKERHVGRGVAMGDYDNDGQMDLAVSNIGEQVSLLQNCSETKNHWLRLCLIGRTSNRDALGAEVIVVSAGRESHYWIKGGASYLAAHDPRLLVGLGNATHAEDVRVRRPSGVVQIWTDLAMDRTYRLYEDAN
jgi:enediyne biosynthesis protein E4